MARRPWSGGGTFSDSGGKAGGGKSAGGSPASAAGAGGTMQAVVVTKPYQFVPPVHGLFWTYPLSVWLPGRVRRRWGVQWPEFRGLEHLRASLGAGHGILLAPNHCRPSDPEV